MVSKQTQRSDALAMVTIAIILTVLLISDPISTSVYAAKPSSRFLSAIGCSYNYKESTPTKTCCWREVKTGTIYSTPQTYCQTCKNYFGIYYNCTDPELQFGPNSQGNPDTTSPKKGGGIFNDGSSNSGGSKGIDPGSDNTGTGFGQ
ncbi:MAG TPA: hypothetical protein VH500_08840 [Nitrososphaeraceae archaeon]|jgi:hypothetical protein